MIFTSHNIRFTNGLTTRGNAKLLADSLFMKAILETINQYAPASEGYTSRAADLACHEGGFAVELARLGFDTLGIDARKENLYKANYVKFQTGLENLKFALDDVRNLSKYGLFDVILCTGIVYHLDDPVDFLKMLYKQTNRVLILYSFYAPEFDLVFDIRSMFYNLRGKLRNRLGLKKKKLDINEVYESIGITPEERADTPSYISHIINHKLGPLTRHEGYSGRWYREWSPDSTKEKVEAKVYSAYSNHRSFWFTRKELTRVLLDAGFSSVQEQKAPLGDFHSKYPSSFYGSTMLIAVK